MRLIDANALIEAILDARRSETDTVPKLIRFIEKQPTIAIDDDLISRERLVDDLSDNAGWDFTSRIGMIISRQPTVEPKTGRWIVGNKTSVFDLAGVETWAVRMTCSECSFSLNFVEGHTAQYRFCPQCGARMDKE